MGRVTWKTWDAFLEFLKQASAEKKNKKEYYSIIRRVFKSA
jgi:hypothetical protein